MVYDYKHVTTFTAAASSKYETLPQLAQSLLPGDALLTWDVKDANHHLLMRPEDQRHLAFRCLGRFFVRVTMPFALPPAPMTWTTLLRPLVQHLRELGYLILPYVDNFCRAQPAPHDHSATPAPGVAAYHYIERLFG